MLYSKSTTKKMQFADRYVHLSNNVAVKPDVNIVDTAEHNIRTRKKSDFLLSIFNLAARVIQMLNCAQNLIETKKRVNM